MSVFHSRIIDETYMDTPEYQHPALHDVAPDTPMTMPLAVVSYAANQVLYGTLHPLVTADGAVVPASAMVTYPQTVPAGQP